MLHLGGAHLSREKSSKTIWPTLGEVRFQSLGSFAVLCAGKWKEGGQQYGDDAIAVVVIAYLCLSAET